MKKYLIFNVRDYNFVNLSFNKLPKAITYVIITITAILYKLVTLCLFILLPLYYINELLYVYSYYYPYII
jgi:hypothetical protein